MACRDMDKLVPAFRMVLEQALADAKRWGSMQQPAVDFLVIETYRTQKRQDELYARGRFGNPGPQFTWTRHSKHIDGLAADVVPTIGGRIIWNRKDLYDKWGEVAKGYGLEWGGDFGNYDGAHVQMPG